MYASLPWLYQSEIFEIEVLKVIWLDWSLTINMQIVWIPNPQYILCNIKGSTILHHILKLLFIFSHHDCAELMNGVLGHDFALLRIALTVGQRQPATMRNIAACIVTMNATRLSVWRCVYITCLPVPPYCTMLPDTTYLGISWVTVKQTSLGS